MLNKKQIDNFIKTRNDGKPLSLYKALIIISMIKYYGDMNIINFVDNINIIYSKKKDFTYDEKNNKISIPNNISDISVIEGLLININYLYQNGKLEKGFKSIINILQVEEIMKELLKISLSYDIKGLEGINYKKYKCLVNQVETNLVRPLYRFIKKNDKNIIKNQNRINEYIKDIDNDKLNELNRLFILNNDYICIEENEYEISENFRKIKNIFKSIIKVLEEK